MAQRRGLPAARQLRANQPRRPARPRPYPQEDRLHRYLHAQYRRCWKMHFAKKTRSAVVHQYYDQRTQQHKRQKMSQEEMLQRYVSHIPARHFKMVRYYGFLANRKRGSLLPKVYDALAMTVREKPKRPGFAVLMKGFLALIRTNVSCARGGCVLLVPWQVNTPPNCSLTGCIGWRKSDGFRHRSWISAPEKQVLD